MRPVFFQLNYSAREFAIFDLQFAIGRMPIGPEFAIVGWSARGRTRSITARVSDKDRPSLVDGREGLGPGEIRLAVVDGFGLDLECVAKFGDDASEFAYLVKTIFAL